MNGFEIREMVGERFKIPSRFECRRMISNASVKLGYRG